MAPLFKRRENRDVTVVPADLFRHSIGGASTPTGLSITPDVAMTVTAYFAAVRFHAFAVASLPKILYQRTVQGKRRVSEKKLYSVLHDIPNPEMSSFDLWATLDSHVMVRGNAFAEIVLDENYEVFEIWPLRPDRMELVRGENNELYYVYTLPSKYGGEKKVLESWRVLHLRGLSSDGVLGISQITMMRNAVALAKATEEFGSSFFGNNAESGIVIKHPKKFLNQDAIDRFKMSWESQHMGLTNAHRISVLEEGMSVEKIGLSPEDSQFLQTREFQVYEISRMTDVPPSFIFELTKMNFSTMEQMTLDFVVHHLRPILVSYEQQLYRSVLLQVERDAGYFVENLIDGLLRGDLATRYAAYAVGKQNGWLNTNEVRRMENMNSIGPKGDQYHVPLNMSVLGEDGMPMAVPDANPPQPNTPARSLMVPLLKDAAERIGKRELNEYTNARQKHKNRTEKFGAWVEQFYKRDYPEFILQVTRPFIEAGMVNEEESVRAIAKYCDRRGTEALSDEMSVFVTDEIVKLFEEEQPDE